MRYRIPKQYLDGFKLISQLEPSKVESISSLLSSTDFGLDISNLTGRIYDSGILDRFEYSDVQNLVRTIYSVLSISDDSDEDEQTIFEGLAEAAVYQFRDEIEVEKEKVIKNLTILYHNSGQTKKTLKAQNLLNDNERNFFDSKIITDLRFVFEDHEVETSNMSNTVIVHKLKISFFNERERKEIYFSMDSSDLISLKKTLERAIKKEELIKNNENLSHLKFLSIDENES